MITSNMRIPGSRPFRPTSQKEKDKVPREQSWDNRFHLGKIQDYNAMQDRVANKSKARKVRKKIIILPETQIKKPKKPVVPDLTKCVSVKGLQKPPVVQSQIIKKLAGTLVSTWNSKQIPEPQRDAFLFAIEKLQVKDKSSVLVKEVESLKLDKSLVQAALRSVRKREECIKDLVDFARSIDVPTNNVKSSCVESLVNLRNFSLQAVENIQEWRKKLQSFNESNDIKTIKFIWQGIDYLSKMQNDIKQLESTPIGTFIEFLLNDPFLLHARGGKVEIPVDSNTLKRIKDAEEILKSEGMPEVEKREVPMTPRRLTESRSSRLFLKEEAKQLTLEGITGEIEEQLLQYSLLVPETIQESMGKVENAFATASNLRYPAFLWARIGSETVGLVTLNLENQKSMHKRLYISHFSVIQPDMIEKLLEILLSYIWSTYDCIEIRVGIISKITEQGKYEADKSIKQHFDKKGFRWKQMIYAMNEIPVQLLGLRRPEALEIVKKFYSIFDDSIEMAYACTVQIAAEENVSLKNAPPSRSFSSSIGVSCALKALGKSSLPDLQLIIQKMSGIPPAFRFRKDVKIDNAIKDLQSVSLSVPYLTEDLETSVACSALGLSWTKYLPSIINQTYYTKILAPINILKSSHLSLYIIATEDPQYSVFFIPSENRKNLFEFVKGLLKDVKSNEEAEKIWVPSFCVERQVEIEEVVGSGVDEGKVVKGCVESYRFKVHTAVHDKGGYFLQPEEGELIIKDGFIFGMIHHKVDEEFEVPLFVLYVGREEFIFV